MRRDNGESRPIDSRVARRASRSRYRAAELQSSSNSGGGAHGDFFAVENQAHASRVHSRE